MHTRQRRLVNRWFTPRAVEQRWLPLIEEQTDALLGAIHPESVEFMSEFAIPLPIRVIGSILGIAIEDQIDFKRWSDAFVQTTVRHAPPAVWMDKARAAAEMEQFFTDAF